MPDPVRVRDNETGAEYTTYAVDENGNSYEGLTVLKDESAVDANGALLPPTYPELEPEQDSEPAAAVADVPPASETSTVVPPAAEPEALAPAEVTAASLPAAKQSTKTPRPTEPTTGPKATSKES